MSTRSILGVFAVLTLASLAQAATQEYLVRFNDGSNAGAEQFVTRNTGRMEVVSKEGNLYKYTSEQTVNPAWDASVDYIQPNNKFSILESPSLAENRAALIEALNRAGGTLPNDTNANSTKPAIQNPPLTEKAGADPLLPQAWGMFAIGADKAWTATPKGADIVVAVTDSGMDYNHEDLIANVWRNKNEIPNNGVDDDKNGYIDDIIGWDFATNDNQPYDITKSTLEIILGGGNPGHGTHCSGVIGARLNNDVGTAGVAPAVKIMPLRFITEDGTGNDANAIKAIDYAVANGANIISASWGGEAGDAGDPALKEALQRAQAKGVLFIAAAGNGRANASGSGSAGYDNDTDPKPILPASFDLDNVIAVAAIDSTGALASFSNWGKKSVKVGAPGVKILSTVPGNKYEDTIVDFAGIKATWDGTSMAAPFVSGSAAVIWSMNKSQTWQEVRAKLLASTVPLDSLKDKVATGGRIDLSKLGR